MALRYWKVSVAENAFKLLLPLENIGRGENFRQSCQPARILSQFLKMLLYSLREKK
jgi:hypothetical protein